MSDVTSRVSAAYHQRHLMETLKRGYRPAAADLIKYLRHAEMPQAIRDAIIAALRAPRERPDKRDEAATPKRKGRPRGKGRLRSEQLRFRQLAVRRYREEYEELNDCHVRGAKNKALAIAADKFGCSAKQLRAWIKETA